MTMLDTEVAVVGVGSMGSQALWQLARRNVSALGIEQFAPGHDRGAGHGETRIIRSCYQEGPQYVPLVQEAFRLWRELAEESGNEILTENGALYVGRAHGGYLDEVRATGDAYGLPYEVLTRSVAAARFPQHRLGPDDGGFLDLRAGFVRPELAVTSAARCAERRGARLSTGVRVERVADRGDHVEIRTSAGVVRAGRAIVSTGAWTSQVLPQARLRLFVERQVMLWFRARRPEDFAPERFPIFIRERGGDGTWYGFPAVDGATVKAAIHHDGPAADPDRLDREIHPEDIAPVSELVANAFAGLDPDPVRGVACMYTNTEDGHFVLGHLPGSERIVMLGPMSGHGFKFAAAVGRVGADLAVDGATDLPIGPFSPARFDAAGSVTG
ncbi:MAG: N-methyl-L-tryptophan oxidase [Candidatus Dormiibacterota bacterium]